MEIAYRGKRNMHGKCTVTRANGTDLPPRNDLRNHSPDGFNWGYGGSGPAQLALAITVDQLGAKNEKIWSIYQDFKWAKISTLKGDEWVMTKQEITQFFARYD